MKLTKYEHACFIVEDQGNKLIVDPGQFSTLPEDLSNVSAVVITHEHSDHFSLENIAKIRSASPDVEIFTSREVAAQIDGAVEPLRSQTIKAGPFTLNFGGEMHAEIHPDIPRIHNLTVMIDDSIYYPGDSYDLPGSKPRIVMLPLNAPWAKLFETVEFMKAVQAKTYIPTHNFMLSEAGLGVYQRYPQQTASNLGAEFRILKPGDSIEI